MLQKTCQLNSTLVFLNNTKWVAGKLPQKRKNSFHSPSRSALNDPWNFQAGNIFQGLKKFSNINFSGKMTFTLMKIRKIKISNQNWTKFELKQLQLLSYMMTEHLEQSVLMLNQDSNINGDMDDNGLWPKRLYQVSLTRDALSRDLINITPGF